MKNIVKRGFSLLMALALCLSLLPAMQAPASAAEAVSVTFVQNGITVTTDSHTAGDEIHLPDYSGSAPIDYEFIGWTTAPVSETSTEPTFYAVGDTYEVTAATTFYALYSSTETSGSSDYVKVTKTADIKPGDYVIVYEADKYIMNSGLTKIDAVNNYIKVTITDNTISAAVADPYKVTLAAHSSGYSILAQNGKYIGNTSNTNTLKEEASALVNTITIDNSGNANIVSAGSYLRYNNASNQCRFRYYKSSSYTGQKAIALYAKQAATAVTTYTTTINGAAPEEPVEETYTVSFSVPNHAGVKTPAAMVGGEEGITLPTPTAPAGYTFEGWAIESVDETIVAPTGLLTGAYIPTADTTLYAVYSYEKEVAADAYTLVTSASQLAVGSSVVIAAKEHNYAISTTQNTNNRAQVAITKDGDKLGALDTSVAVFELRAGSISDTFAFYDSVNSGYLYAASSSSNHLKTQTKLDADASFAITVTTKGVATITAQGSHSRNTMRYNKSSSLFACYAPSNTQLDLSLYVKSAGGTSIVTYYTSDIDLGAQADDTLKFKGVNLTLADSQHLNFNILKSVADQYEDVYVVFEAEGKETVVLDSYSFTHTDASSAVRYNYSYQALTILDFDTTVTATIYGTKDGVLYAASASYSLLDFCDKAITTETADKVACAYLLKYVQAAEEYKNVANRIDAPAELESMLDDSIESAEPSKTYTLNNGEQVKFKGQYLTMEARTTLNVKVLLADKTVDTSKITITAAYTNAAGALVTKTYTFADLVAGDEADVYVLAFGELYATQMSSDVKFAILVDGVTESTLDTSIESYCTGILAGDDSAAMKELALRIFLYGKAAEAAYPS